MKCVSVCACGVRACVIDVCEDVCERWNDGRCEVCMCVPVL